MREYTQDAKEDTIEKFSKKILEGTFGEGRYIQSFKGGDCVNIYGEPVPRFKIRNLPKSEEELFLKLDLAGIDWQVIKIQLRKSKDG